MSRKMSIYLKPPEVVVDESLASQFLNQELERKLDEEKKCVTEKVLDMEVSEDEENDSFDIEAPSASFSEMSLGDPLKQPKKSMKKTAGKGNNSKAEPELEPDPQEAAGAEGVAYPPESDVPAGNRADTPIPEEKENEGGRDGIRASRSSTGWDAGSDGSWVETYWGKK